MTNTVHPVDAHPVPITDSSRRRGAYALVLCHRHAAALLTVASLVLDDVDTAGDIVASTIAAACRDSDSEPSAPTVTRMQLAQSVYRRCLGHQAFIERFPELNLAQHHGRKPTVDHLTADQRAILALIVFGGHDVAQAAELLQKPISKMMAELSQMPPR